MIFIRPEDNQSIFIPKHNLAEGPFKLILEHNLSHKVTEFENLENHGNKAGYWIFTGLDFRYLAAGEYTYSLIAANVVPEEQRDFVSGWQKEKGLLQVMSTLKDPISYKTSTEKIIYNK